jgi:Flp pilus assembly protein TadD
MQTLAQPPEPVVDEQSCLLMDRARHHVSHNRLVEAAKCFLEVTRSQPDCFEAHCQLGALLNQLNQSEAALACLQKAASLKPSFPKLHLLQGAVLKKLRRFEEAADCCRREIQLTPGNADAYYNLGLVLQNLGRLGEAVRAYQQALELRPGYIDALVNLGTVYRRRLDLNSARHCFQDAVHREPLNPHAHWELCTTLLSQGDYTRGWPEYEWRWKLNDFTTPASRFDRPVWDGSPLKGRRILLHAEQGFGDIIQFVRYAPLVARRGGKVLLGCPKALRPLLGGLSGVTQILNSRVDLPPFDLHAPLMSLPAIFRTTLESVPADVPYLTPPAGTFLLDDADNTRLNVGIVWAGEASHRDDANRSMPLDFFQPLVEMPSVRWHSLQVGPRVSDLHRLQRADKVIDVGSRLRDFADTARAIAQLDLVISVDTAVAHLAGALAKPVWTLLPFAAEWRWMIGREDSPWYPTMRLFRQRSPGDWQGLVSRVRRELQSLAGRSLIRQSVPA